MSIKRKLEIAKSLSRFYPPETFERIFEEAQKEAEAIDYSSLSSSELKTIAKEKSIPKYYKMKKAELIEALNGLE